jgi:toxin ParE1/3/4
MGLRIVWTQTARERVSEIVGYISQRDLVAAERLAQRLESAVTPLAEHPYLYRPGRHAGTRELVIHPNYILVYRVLDEAVEIVTIVHSRQRYPLA